MDLIPFVTCVGESIRVLRTAGKFSDGADMTIDTYRNLRKLSKGTNKEVHHILEKRFIDQLKLKNNKNDMFGIILSKSDHLEYTNKWRKLTYGQTYDMETVLKTGINIYFENPMLTAAFLLSFQ